MKVCCGKVDERLIGQRVVLHGWVDSRRDHGGLIFIDLRDRWGKVQVVVNPAVSASAHEAAQLVRSEYVIGVSGTVSRRPPGSENPSLPTGNVEVIADDLTVLSRSKPMPFPIEDNVDVDERIRLEYRYIDLRRPRMQKNLITRHRMNQLIRQKMDELGFVEIETPMLIKSTPEGARDFLVPSRMHPGCFYALPQSPQILKQLLMVAGIGRYYQIARCFRDEDLRSDRQPEFTQLDLEMSFCDVNDVLNVVEEVICHVFKSILDYDFPRPFDRIPYKNALETYGTDKPDRRLGMVIKDYTEIVKKLQFPPFDKAIASGGAVLGVVAPNGAGLTRKQIESLIGVARSEGASGLVHIGFSQNAVTSPLEKYLDHAVREQIWEHAAIRDEDLLLLVAAKREVALNTLGRLRLELAKLLDIQPTGHEALFIVDFPLFELDQEDHLTPAHHPFARPHDEDIPLLDEDPLAVRAFAYDLVVDGYEIGSGNLRIFDSELQHKIFKILGLDEHEIEQRFGFMLRAFEYGVPPHGGIALGLDRLAMILCGEETIRDVIAFPKTQQAQDLMLGAPSPVTDEQLKELSIDILRHSEE